MVLPTTNRAIPLLQTGFIFLVIVMLLLSSSGWQGNTRAQAQTMSWSQAERLTSSNVDSVGPDIAIDSTGVSHIVYVETDFGSKGDVYYRHNRSGEWSTPVKLSEGTRTEPGGGNRQIDIATTTINGVVFLGLAYQGRLETGRRRIFYRVSADGGLTWSEREEATSNSAIHPSLILDDLGTPHLAYIKSGDDELLARYTYRTATGWVDFEDVSNDEDRNPSITSIRDTSGFQWIHLFFQTRPEGGGQTDMRIVSRIRSPDGTWSPLVDHDNDIAQFPKIVSDLQTTVYAVWSSKEEEVDIEPYFSRSDNNGNTWTAKQRIGTNTDDLGQRPAIARSPATGKLAVVWEDDYDADEFKYDIFTRMSSDNGQTWTAFEPIFEASGGSGSSNIDATPTDGFRVVWDDGVDGKLRILTSDYNDRLMPGTPQPTDTTPTTEPTDTTPTTEPTDTTPTTEPTDTTPTTEPSPTATLPPGTAPVATISVDPAVAASNTVSVTINATGADMYQLSNDGVTFTDYAPLAPGGATVPWTLVALPGSDDPVCTVQTIYARVKDSVSGLESAIAFTTVQRDTGVDVTVSAYNPYLADNDLLLQDYGGEGASDGDPGFTRSDFFLLEVIINQGECSGLAEVNAGASVSLRDNELSSITQAIVPFDTFELIDGVRTVTVTVTDNAGNVQTYTPPITVDTMPPVVSNDAAALTASPSSITEETPMVDLAFANLVITDTYRHSQNASQQFWGMWLANSPNNIDVTDTAELDKLVWEPVEVPGTGSSGNFTISNWNLATGFWEILPGGEFYVYARVLDGAGNASTRTLQSNAIQVQVDVIPVPDGTVYLPLIGR